MRRAGQISGLRTMVEACAFYDSRRNKNGRGKYKKYEWVENRIKEITENRGGNYSL